MSPDAPVESPHRLVIAPLLRMNWTAHYHHVKYFRPVFERRTRPLYMFLRRHVIWRL